MPSLARSGSALGDGPCTVRSSAGRRALHHGPPPSLPDGLRTANGNKASACYDPYTSLTWRALVLQHILQISPRNLLPVLSFSGRGESETIQCEVPLLRCDEQGGGTTLHCDVLVGPCIRKETDQVPRHPQVSQPTHFTLTYKLMSSYFGVRGVGWETYGSLETSEKVKGR